MNSVKPVGRLAVAVLAAMAYMPFTSHAGDDQAETDHAEWQAEHGQWSEEHAAWELDHQRGLAAAHKLLWIIHDHAQAIRSHEAEMASHAQVIESHRDAATSDSSDQAGMDGRHAESASVHEAVGETHRRYEGLHEEVNRIIEMIDRLPPPPAP